MGHHGKKKKRGYVAEGEKGQGRITGGIKKEWEEKNSNGFVENGG